MKIEIYGSRGSVPSPGKDTCLYGGNTSCYSVRLKSGRQIIFDAGNGISALGNDLLGSGINEADLFLSHMHLDHVLGLPFFGPVFRPGFTLNLYSQDRNGLNPLEQLSGLFRAPYWPVGPKDFSAAIFCHTLAPGDTVRKEDYILTARQSSHPDQCLCFRLEAEGKAVVYALDFEHDSEGIAGLTSFAQDADILIYDAQYLESEYSGKVGWGHSTWEQGVALAGNAGVKFIIFSHHLPGRTDRQLCVMETAAKKCFPDCTFAKERVVLEL